ncbi:MAG: hypothetical protein WD904_01605 [Dehalococcoidia bacterium]
MRDGWRQHTSEDDFSIEYPADWTVGQLPGASVTFRGPEDGIFDAVQVFYRTDPNLDSTLLTFEDVKARQINGIRELGVEPEVLESRMVDGTVGSVVRYSFVVGTADVLVTSVAFVSRGRFWLLGLGSPPQNPGVYDEVFREMLDSFTTDSSEE